MNTKLIDTHPEIDKIQIALFKRESIQEKFAQVRSLSTMTIQLSKRAISRVHKHLDDKQINLLYIDYQFGKDLSRRVKEFLNKR